MFPRFCDLFHNRVAGKPAPGRALPSERFAYTMKYVSTLFTEASGKVGNIVASKGHAGQYFRSKVKPANPKSLAQTNVRAAFGTNSKAYSGLTEAQRNGWAGLGAQMTVTNPLGQKSTLTGAQAYASINGTLATVGAPAISDSPSAPAQMPAFPTITLAASRTGAANGPFTLSIESAAYNGQVIIKAVRPVRAGRNSFSPSAFRQIGTEAGLSAGSTSLTAMYVAKFGTPNVGDKIAVMLVPVTNNGFQGGHYIAIAVVAVGT